MSEVCWRRVRRVVEVNTITPLLCMCCLSLVLFRSFRADLLSEFVVMLRVYIYILCIYLYIQYVYVFHVFVDVVLCYSVFCVVLSMLLYLCIFVFV